MSGDGKPPTVYEDMWDAFIRELTCGVCWRISDEHRIPGWDKKMEEGHHIIDGGRRIGHGMKVPACNFHHQMPGGPKAWERTYKFTELDVMNDTVGRVMALIRQKGIR